ncbi:MAG: hypothetical protein HZA04_06655 [Nitrospinae bacterium]|nr:hypothetical protein [Nitrospinota bacterium]
MPKIDRGLMEKTRSENKRFHADLAKGVVKTGKEKVRDTAYKNAQNNVSRRNAYIQKFLTEEGKGGGTDIVA